MHPQSHTSPDMDQTVRSTVDPNVDIITRVPFQIKFLGWQIAVAINYQPEEQVIHEFPWLTYHNPFQNDFIDQKNLLVPESSQLGDLK